MPRVTLREFQTTSAIELTVSERDHLHSLAPSILVTPSAGRSDAYDLKPSQWIGSVHIGDLELVVLPKVAIEHVLFLVSYAVNLGRWQEASVSLAPADSLVEAIIPSFTFQLRRALSRGVLQGYRTYDDALLTVRGRWRIGDQIRGRYGVVPPVEVTFDDYTEDIELNRLLRAAIHRILAFPVRDQRSTWGLRAIESTLRDVSLVDYEPKRVPIVRYDRLTRRYRPAVELARLILASASFELRHGETQSRAFLIDMNKVFEEFVVAALREALGSSCGVLVQGARGRQLFLDGGRRIPLQPDLSLWDGVRCTFVGDVKYKRLVSDAVPNADLYQLLAYTIATDLPAGLLIYAAGDEAPAVHDVALASKRLETIAIDLTGSPESTLAQVTAIANRVRHRASEQARRTESSAPKWTMLQASP